MMRSVAGVGRKLAVCVSPMANAQDRDVMSRVVHVIHDPVVALTQAVHILRVRQLLDTMRARIAGQMQYVVMRTSQIGFGKTSKFFASRRDKRDAIRDHPASVLSLSERVGCGVLSDVLLRSADPWHLPKMPANACIPSGAVGWLSDAHAHPAPLAHAMLPSLIASPFLTRSHTLTFFKEQSDSFRETSTSFFHALTTTGDPQLRAIADEGVPFFEDQRGKSHLLHSTLSIAQSISLNQ